MTQTKQHTIKLDGKSISIETGLFGAQASGAVTVRCGDTVVLATVVSGGIKEGQDFFPLQVEYREKHYAGGIISSSRFIKREGRPSDNEILTSRLIDRSIRPLFPSDLLNEVQVVVSPLSIDGENEPEILGIIGASAAIAISNIPWGGPVGAVRIGLVDGKYVVNPSADEKAKSVLDLVLAGGTGSIAMVEAGANEVSEDQIIAAMEFGQNHIDTIVTEIAAFAKKNGRDKFEVPAIVADDAVKAVAGRLDAKKVLSDSKTAGGEGIKIGEIVASLITESDPEDLNKIILARVVDEELKQEMRRQILKDGNRIDNRKVDEIRQITVQVGLLPRTHGSGFFQRGMTHALSIATLGSPDDVQLIDGMKGEEEKRYMHHYNMPGFATGEPGRIGNPNRREIGHGALAERALVPVLPSEEEFPYVVRVVSEIMSGNGSTSQASICGSTLALMDAGVPIKKPVAGIAMGLIKEGDTAVTLSDIAGIEDHFGDMDFKVAGTPDGITAMQMDVKIPGVTAAILTQALAQAKAGRAHILGKMTEVISEPRKEISQYAPRIEFFTIDPEKIGAVIGSGGKTIRQIQTDFGVDVNIDDDGKVAITGVDSTKVKEAAEFIKNMLQEPEVGQVYTGKVTRIMDFGAFVEILPGQEGMVHVSNMGEGFVGSPRDKVSEGDEVQVKVYEIDRQGRVNLTMNLDAEPNRGRGGGDRGGDRGGFDRGGDRPRRSFDRGGDRGERSFSRGGDRPRREGGMRRENGFSRDGERGRGRAPRGESRFKKFNDHR